MFQNNLLMAAAGGPSAVSVEYQTAEVDTSDVSSPTPYTFSSQAIGTAAADRIVVVGVGGSDYGATLNTVTIGGASTTVLCKVESNATAAIAVANIASGTTADIVVLWSGRRLECGIAIWAMYGASITPHDTMTATSENLSPSMSGTIDQIENGATIGFFTGASQITAMAWTGLTENFEILVGAGSSDKSWGGASLLNTTTISGGTISMVNSGSTPYASGRLAVASFAQA